MTHSRLLSVRDENKIILYVIFTVGLRRGRKIPKANETNFPLHSPPFSLLFPPLPLLKSRAPKIQLMGLRERCKPPAGIEVGAF